MYNRIRGEINNRELCRWEGSTADCHCIIWEKLLTVQTDSESAVWD